MAARFRSAILDEKKRSAVCAAATILVAAPVSYLWLRHEGAPAEHAAAVGAVIVWTVFAVVEAGATFLAYRGLTRDQLIAVLKADTGAATDVESPRAEQQQSESVSAETGPGAIVQAFAGRLSRSIEGQLLAESTASDVLQIAAIEGGHTPALGHGRSNR